METIKEKLPLAGEVLQHTIEAWGARLDAAVKERNLNQADLCLRKIKLLDEAWCLCAAEGK
jgi:hypothetical protein